MAKKQKRSVSSSRPSVPTTTAAPERPVFSTSAMRSSYSQEFNPDYSQVVQDLKKIGIMAGSFIAILVVLSFFLR
jgi:hypothetical protein